MAKEIMTAGERLADALKVAGKSKGYREPKYDNAGAMVGHGRQHIEVMASDVAEVANMIKEHTHQTSALLKGCTTHGHGEEHTVILYADDLFHLLEKVGV